jgi:phosphoribosyl 1,2-cyclic phosphodiesterase
MKGIRFWGTRGSLPVALTAEEVRRKVVAALVAAKGQAFAGQHDVQAFVDRLGFAVAGTFGGHTSCVELVTGGGEFVICDLGTGVRPFGQAVQDKHGSSTPQTYHVFVSHLHWDHIMGLPFFMPAYVPGNRIRFYGGHAELEAALRRQQDPPSFPVDFTTFSADIEFMRLEPGRRYEIAGMGVTAKLQRHPGDSYGYRFESGGRTVVYSTDSEHDLSDAKATAGFVEFFRDADVVIFDAMFSLAEEATTCADWGHSSNVVGVELCQAAGVKQLCLFHHKPGSDDDTLARILEDTRRLESLTRNETPLTVSAAYDGMVIPL